MARRRGLTEQREERSWWAEIGDLRWQHVVLIVAAIAGLVAMTIFSGDLGCSVKINSEPTTTTVAP